MKDTADEGTREKGEQEQSASSPWQSLDLAAIFGQQYAKRAIEIAAAGRHSVVFEGPPGFGKTMLAHALISLMAPEPFVELMSAVTESCLPALLREAAGGLVYLGDLAALRPVTVLPLIQRAAEREPRVTLVAEMRPCPCGYYGDPVQECKCSAMLLQSYQARLDPLTAYTDLHVRISRLEAHDMLDPRKAETTAVVHRRVAAARERQRRRFAGMGLRYNAEMGPVEVGVYCRRDASGEKLLKTALQQLHLSVRAYHRLLKLARTIADLAESDTIMANHVAEAIQYRP